MSARVLLRAYHSPASGQGLNTGIQDALNLAWKLTMVLHGHADASLLDTYDAERVPIGQALLASTGEVMATAMVDPSEGAHETSAEGMRAFQRTLIRNMSGLGIAYPDSPLTVASEAPTGPTPGERLTQVTAAQAQSPGWTVLRDRLRTPYWHLITLDTADSGSAPAVSVPEWVDVVTVTTVRGTGDVWDSDGEVARTLGLAPDRGSSSARTAT